jgi:hypothetical protein
VLLALNNRKNTGDDYMEKSVENYIVKFDEDVTSFFFYNKMLPSLHEYFKFHRDSDLYFDFSDVEFVNPLVIPNILTLAVILKEYFGQPVRLFIPWKPRLLSYLADIKFIDIVTRYSLFDIDEGYIGDYETHKIKEECKTFVFSYDSDEEYIYNSISLSNEIFKNIYRDDPNISVEKLDNLKKILTEICKNGCSHSKSMCFATMQTNLSRNIKFKKAYISISDCGIGYYDSIRSKILDSGFLPYFMDKDDYLKLEAIYEKDIAGILEAIFFRRDQAIYGMYDVINRVVANDGIVRIHSCQTQLIFTKNNFSHYLNDNKKLLNDFKTKYDESIKSNLNTKYSSVRNSEAKFKGVHIEIEIPIS